MRLTLVAKSETISIGNGLVLRLRKRAEKKEEPRDKEWEQSEPKGIQKSIRKSAFYRG